MNSGPVKPIFSALIWTFCKNACVLTKESGEKEKVLGEKTYKNKFKNSIN